MSWVYLSPHFDDVALSCGGLVWEQAQAGNQVSLWTLCAGEPAPGELSPFAQMLHARWEAGVNAPVRRKQEDILSCQILGASYRHFTLPDCIYRRAPITGEFMYASEASLTGPLHPGDAPLIQDLHQEFGRLLPPGVTLVCPLALGNHVDHQLTRLAVESSNFKVYYYADFPYILSHKDQLSRLEAAGWSSQIFPISSAGLHAWQDSIAAHASQISTFWTGESKMRQAIENYWLESGGIHFWVNPAG